MAQQKIELRRIRDFSENLNDTFVFIKQNLKPLLTSFLGISGIFMLSSAIISGIYQNEVGDILEQVIGGADEPDDESLSDSIFSPNYFLVLLLAWLNVTAMKVSLIVYVKVYERKQGETPQFNEVWNEFSRNFLRIFLYSIPVVLVVIVGFILCLVPGFYLWVVLMPFEIIFMMENASFREAWDRSFMLIKENFWTSFLIYAIAYLIYMVSTSVIGGIISIITGIFAYFTTNDISTTTALISSVLNVFSFAFFIIFYISALLNYFSLSEMFDGTGLLRRIDNLGDNKPTHHTDEEY